MSIYIVTGKLGGGKTLAAVSKINDALSKGLRVATNLDVDLVKLPSCRRTSRHCRVLRVPDRPSVDDIRAIGFGREGVSSLSEARRNYDESRFGLLVLDECGTWLNSREWQEDGRRELINFLLHIRKHLWDVYLIIQDVSMLDKQARKALAEHVVYCRRMDRLAIPVLGALIGLFTGTRLKMPKFHLGIVKYGDQPQSITVDRWWYNGTALYEAYDTTQVFSPDYSHGVYSVLPPWHVYRRGLTTWGMIKIMRLTTIYLRQYSRTLLLAAGLFAGGSIALALSPDKQVNEVLPVAAEEGEAAVVLESPTLATKEDPGLPLVYRLRVKSFAEGFGQAADVWFTDGSQDYSIRSLQYLGVHVARTGTCRFRFDHDGETSVVSCFD